MRGWTRIAAALACALAALGPGASFSAAAKRARLPAWPPSAPAPWPSMRHDIHNTGASPVPAVYHGDRPWAFATGRGLFITPVVAGDGAIYFGSADNNFYALNANGSERWHLTAGNIFDAAATLDPQQRTVTIGSGDEYLYHLSTDPHRMPIAARTLWRFHPTSKPVPGQLVNWWEDDVAYGPDGNIYTGNTGGGIYSFTPAGRLRWEYLGAGNSVWTMPAFTSAGTTLWGSVDRSMYALKPDGTKAWSTPTLGFVISSPALGSDGTEYVGSFDSKLYAIDSATGLPKWTFGTNDHIYSSPALALDPQGRTREIYIASTDGSVYALTPAGKLIWSYDTGEPIRSSPVLGAGAPGENRQILYVGASDGSLYALNADTGRRRWSFNTVSSDRILHDRHELNSSPALSTTGVYIGSEDGHLWYVPYDYCLHHADSRCTTNPGSPYPADISRVYPVTPGDTTERSGQMGPLPSSAEITGRLVVRSGANTTYAGMIPAPSAAGLIRTTPAFPFHAQISGDGRYVFITPDTMLAPGTTYSVEVSGRWGAGGIRVANYTLPVGYTKYSEFSDAFTFNTAPDTGPLPLSTGPDQVSAFRLRRLAAPLPAFLPSVNQIGFDSYVLIVGTIAVGPPGPDGTGSLLLWATQAKPGPGGTYVADPAGTLTFPLAGSYRNNTVSVAVHNAVLTFSFGQVPLQTLSLGFQLGRNLQSAPDASLYAQAQCATIPNYGPAVYITGICNSAGELPAAGTFITDAYRPARRSRRLPAPPPAANRRPAGLSVSGLSYVPPSLLSAGSLTARFALAPGVAYPAADHRIGLLLIDAATGQPVGLNYTLQRTETDAAGNVRGATLTIPAATSMPRRLRAYVISDVFPLLSRDL